MNFVLQPWPLLLVILAGWSNRQQQDVIEYLRTENLRSLKEECLERLIFFGKQSLRQTVRRFLGHYHTGRNHQGLDNRILQPGDEVGKAVGDVAYRERLGGTLRYYYRQAA